MNDPTRSLWAYVDIDQMNAYYGVETPGFPAVYMHLVDGPVFEGLSYFEPVKPPSQQPLALRADLVQLGAHFECCLRVIHEP